MLDLSFPDSTYTSANKPSVETLKGDLSLIESDVNAHESASEAHGATGAVVGTTNTQTLTSKTLTSPKINEDVALTATATELNLLHSNLGAWTSYNPTWQLVNASSQNGIKTGGYTKIGKTVHFWANFVVDGTSNFGGLTSVYVGFPVTAKDGLNGMSVTGHGLCGGTYFPIGFISGDTSATHIVCYTTGSSYAGISDITVTIPGYFGVGNYLYISGTYESA